MTIGERIRTLRDQKNISQTDLAIKIDISKQTLYKYENDIITNIPSDKIEAIANVLNVSPCFIMGWSSQKTNSTLQLTATEEIYIKKYRTLDEYGKKNVDNVLDNEYTRCSESKITFLKDVAATYQIDTLAAHEIDGATEDEKLADYELIKKIAKEVNKNAD